MNLLQLLYQNAYTGAETLRLLLAESDDQIFCRALSDQLLEYQSASDAAAELLCDVSLLPELPRYFRLELFSRLIAPSHRNTSSLARLLTQGCTDGISEIRHSLNLTPNQDRRVLRLAEQLIFLEESTIYLMYQYL